MNRHPKVIINALAAAAACFLALGFSSCTTEEMEASLSYSPTSVSVSSTGGSFEIALSATVSYSVSVSGDWLWPSSNDLYWLYGCGYFCRVPGNAVLEFTAEANTSSSSRTTTIKITAGDLSATVSVTQAGADGSGDEDDTEDEDSGDSSDDSGDDSYDVSGTLNGYEYVDLGLSVMWATCNVGADSPEDYGDYYAWGETETKDTYTLSNSVTYGVSMSDIAGNAYYDAATANWGGTWRMPTESEMEELINNCTWTWTTLYGVKCYKVIGTNGNSIFLPAAGFCDGSILRNAGSNGYYWSSTPYTSYTDYAYDVEFGSSSVSRNRNLRYYGLCVRPVFGDSSGDSSDGASSLSVSPTTVSVAAAGESFTVTVTCDTDYSVDVSDDWLTLNSNSNGTLSFTADANTSGSSRTATITVTAGDLSETVTVTQAGISLSVSPTSVSVAAAGGTFSITVTCNVSYSTSYSVSWLTLDSASGDVYSYTASENMSTSSRTGTITVTAGKVSATVTVTQEGADDLGDDSSGGDSGSGDDDSSGTINGYEYVDLGLSVKWATCNIGADSPEDYGNYYAWGETETKSTYTSSNSVTYGVSMSDFSGDAEYDAATANWGSPWRMPTDSELTELRTSCTWTWTTYNGVNGYEVTGTNGNSIFLPAAGRSGSSSLYSAGSYGSYWSSTPYSSSTNSAYYLYFSSSDVYRSFNYRYFGRSVRPVSE